MVKIKDKNHHLAIVIKENYSHGMNPKEIANLFHLSKQKYFCTVESLFPLSAYFNRGTNKIR